MLKFFSVLGFCSLLFTSSIALALEGVGVMVLDSPVDYRHTMLAPVIDTAAMSRYSFADAGGASLSWLELTEHYFEEFRSQMDPSLRAQVFGYIDHVMNLENPASLRDSERERLAAFFAACSDKQAAFERVSHYLHGTHVAGLAVGGLPVYGTFDPSSLGELLGNIFRANAERHGQNMEILTRAISEQEIQVVNMSFGKAWSGSIEETLSDQLPLFISNPNTVFVIAAGNDHIDMHGNLSETGQMFPTSGVRNVLFVAALDESGDLAAFSNYGVGVVDIAAQGTGVVSARSGGGLMHLDGTSMAAPIVTAHLARIRYEHPELSAVEAIRYLLDHDTLRNESLSGQVTEGRFLPLSAELGY
jgi:subtilisin family serine protease